jgi:phosphonate degradation associated HDIG domain protein
VIARSVDELFDLYGRWGHDPYDEVVSQLAHALQTAALAVAAGAPDPLVAAALLHDVGHLLALADAGSPSDGVEDLHHEGVGARYLAGLFPATVTGPVANHVRAKRYRCAVNPGYLSVLSEGSKLSLRRQGGPMTDAEARGFEATPGYADAARLREWDDAAKVVGLHVPPLERYRDLLERLV